MLTETELDTLLAGTLAPPPRAEDRQFVITALLQIAEYERFRAQRRRVWRDGLTQLAALSALVIGLIRFSQLPVFGGIGLPATTLIGIAPPLVLVLALWLATSGALGRIGHGAGGPARWGPEIGGSSRR